jgi:chromate reductase, NAD(P)H dehydrogenase (quinone)
MNKVVIFSCTNRPSSNTLKVSRIYEQILTELGVDASILDFQLLPETITASETFGRRTEKFSEIVNNYVFSQNRFVFILPEYNGSFPGILKTFIDCLPPKEWANKKACLVGIADGRAGNLRGMEHLTGILQYLKMHVYHNKLPISLVTKLIDADAKFNDDQLKVSTMQLKGFLEF